MIKENVHFNVSFEFRTAGDKVSKIIFKFWKRRRTKNCSRFVFYNNKTWNWPNVRSIWKASLMRTSGSFDKNKPISVQEIGQLL